MLWFIFMMLIMLAVETATVTKPQIIQAATATSIDARNIRAYTRSSQFG